MWKLSLWVAMLHVTRAVSSGKVGASQDHMHACAPPFLSTPLKAWPTVKNNEPSAFFWRVCVNPGLTVDSIPVRDRGHGGRSPSCAKDATQGNEGRPEQFCVEGA
jgi:hypothetical protein